MLSSLDVVKHDRGIQTLHNVLSSLLLYTGDTWGMEQRSETGFTDGIGTATCTHTCTYMYMCIRPAA
jgi:hypothetical protein